MEQNRWIAQAFLHAVGHGDVDTVEELMAPDATWEVVPAVPESHPLPGVQTRREFIDVVRQLPSQFPNGIKYEIHSLVADGARIAIEATCDGWTGDLQYRNRYAFFMTVHDGQVTSGREYLDFAYLKDFIARVSEKS